jgi:uncharacterized protein YebE (UPF0316 family)
MGNINNFACYFGYAAGFATGNYVGLRIEERLAMGNLLIRVISHKDANQLIKNLNIKGYGATVVDAEGSMGKVQLIYSIVKREYLPDVVAIIQEFNPKAFYSIEDIRKVSAGIFPNQPSMDKLNPFKRWRKGK